MNSKIYLTDTDTTIGFLSQKQDILISAKQRPSGKPFIETINSLKTLKQQTRVPKKHKNRVRRASESTFIMPNSHSYRVVTDKRHLLLLERLKIVYSTSANLSGQTYDQDYAIGVADIIIFPLNCTQKIPSKIFSINNRSIKAIR